MTGADQGAKAYPGSFVRATLPVKARPLRGLGGLDGHGASARLGQGIGPGGAVGLSPD